MTAGREDARLANRMAGRVKTTMAALARLRRSPKVADRIPRGLRVLDLAIVLLTLPILLPVGLLVAVAVFLDSPGPVIYRSQRVGKGGLVFEMLKFRTMTRDAEGPPLSAAGDERYTPLGRRLAISRLDELPQLWNVLKGDMRLVGPRPELESFVADYAAEYERILSVPPGLTGPAQVAYAWEGEVLAKALAVDRARVYRESILPYKLKIDLAYVARHSVLRDIGLLAKTFVLPLHQIGVRMVEGLPGRSFAARIVPALGLTGLLLVFTAVYTIEVIAPA
jgi:lipopolysaccharide/colanic/teichoic acid biosynthesis glycosyltransferase